MLVVGLTGGIGAGKSTFAGILSDNGVRVVDVDAIGRDVIAPGAPGGEAVAARFGTTDRREIARHVFADPLARRDLEAISWPLIEERLRSVVDTSSDALIVLDMAVLPQGLGKGIYGPVITVEAAVELRVARLVERGMDEADARARMDAQTSEELRRGMADFVVDNTGSVEDLHRVASEILEALAARNRG